MSFTLDAVRPRGIRITAAPQIFRQPSSHARVRKSDLFDLSHRSWPRGLLKMNGIGVRPSARAFKHAGHSKPYAYGLPCLTTCGQQREGKDRPRRTVIARCEMERKECGCDQTPGHEEGQHCEEKNMCHKREHLHSEHTFGNEEGHQQCEERKWSKRAEIEHAHSDHAPGHEEGHHQYEEKKCRKSDHAHLERTPGCEEKKCSKREHAHSEHTSGCEEKKGRKSEHPHSEHTPACLEGRLREWKGAKDARRCLKKKGAHGEISVGSKAESEWQEEEGSHREYTPRHSGGEEKDRMSSTLSVADKGYVIKVSKELMGLFCYIEKRKRTMIKELAETLKQIAAVSVVITCVRGIFAPLVEVFKTSPPSWSKLLLMLVSFDSIAVCYLTIKSAEPLEQLAAITTENRRDIMESIEKEEEMILKIAIEFIRLFKRLRNIAISITVSQTAQLIFTVLKLKDPNFVVNCLRVVQTWLQAPWT